MACGLVEALARGGARGYHGRVTRTAPIILVLGVSALVSCRPGTVELSPAHADAMRDSVREAAARFQRFSASAQWDSLGALYSDEPGFRFLESGAVQYPSARAVREALARLPPGVSITTTYGDLFVDPVRPGVAVLSGLFHSTFGDSAGPQFSFSGAVSVLWVHEPGGWRIRGGHSSVPVARAP